MAGPSADDATAHGASTSDCAWRIDESSPAKGRTLVATNFIARGSVVFHEQPLVVAEASNSGPTPLRGGVPAVAVELLRRRLRDTAPFNQLQHRAPVLQNSNVHERQQPAEDELRARLHRRLSRFANREEWVRDIQSSIAMQHASDFATPPTMPDVAWALGVASINAHGGRDGQARLGWLSSMPEHSCAPTAEIDIGSDNEISGLCLKLVTIKDVAAGEPLSIAYVATTWPYAERQLVLSLQYGFHCVCERCKIDLEQQQQQQQEQQLLDADSDTSWEPFLPKLLASDPLATIGS